MNAQAKAPTASVPIQGEVKIDWTKIDTPVQRDGKKIVLPGDPEEMPYDVAISTIQRVRDSEAQTYDVTEDVEGLPWDALTAIFRAMQELYGVVLPETMQTWFGPRNPTFLSIRTGPQPSDVIQVPFGQLSLPGWTTPIVAHLTEDGARMHGKVNKKDRAGLVEIAALARTIVSTDSIYKGKAFRLLVDDDGDLDVNQQPEFIDLAGVTEHNMLHNELTAAIIRTSILAPLKHSAACKKHGVSLKRGILLEGVYGTGKTLTARITAKVAVDNGWTFIDLGRAQGLTSALAVAKRYQPSVVFAEDIDRFADREDEDVNDLINRMDGLVPAGAELMTVLTTNNVEKIDRALLRPGRFDAVISLDTPDATTVQRLVRHYGGAELPEAIPLERLGDMMAGRVPAMIEEAVKRAKLAMLVEDRDQLTEEDLLASAESMKRQAALLEAKPPEPSAGDELASALKRVFTEAMPVDEIGDDLKRIANAVAPQF